MKKLDDEQRAEIKKKAEPYLFIIGLIGFLLGIPAGLLLAKILW